MSPKSVLVDGNFNIICISFAVLEDLRVHLESPEQIVEMKFLLLEQKYLELLYKGNSIEALKVSFPFNIWQFLSNDIYFTSEISKNFTSEYKRGIHTERVSETNFGDMN